MALRLHLNQFSCQRLSCLLGLQETDLHSKKHRIINQLLTQEQQVRVPGDKLILNMSPDKKKQHYVPQFYLKGFSHNRDETFIGVYVLEQRKHLARVPLKDQAYENYFYGKDGKLEDALCDLEGKAGAVINNIIEANSPPAWPSQEIATLLTFSVILHDRTKSAADEKNEMTDKMLKRVLANHPELKNDLDKVQLQLTNAAAFSVSMAAQSLPAACDLKCKLLVNRTSTGFITSDNPVVYYNQFMENRPRYGSTTGLACKGLQIFLPLSPAHCALFYDSEVYGVGYKRRTSVDITSVWDVLALNTLQTLSAVECLFFDQTVANDATYGLLRDSEPHRRDKLAHLDEWAQAQTTGKGKSLLVVYREDLWINPRFSFVRTLKRARKYDTRGRVSHPRKGTVGPFINEYWELVKRGKYKKNEFPVFLKDRLGGSQERVSTLSPKTTQDPAQENKSEGLRILTGPDCAALLEDLKKILSETGLELEEMDLWKDLDDVRWLATQSGPALNLNDPDKASRQRRLIGFRDAVFIKRSIKALELTRELDGWTNPTGRLRYWRIREIVGEESSPAVQKAQQSLDFLYEVEIASRLRFKFSKVRFAEPDLYIESPDSPVAWTIACKRPRAVKSLPSAVRKAVEQITKQKHLGIVMISLDNIVNRTVIDISGNSLEPTCHARMTECTNGFSKDVLAEIQSFPPSPASPTDPDAGQGILGVLTSAAFLLLGKVGPEGPVFLNTRMEPSMINRNDPEWARKATYFVLNQLKAADEMLKSNY